MIKIYELKIVNNKLMGKVSPDRWRVLKKVVYFNSLSGLLYTANNGYIVMSYAEGEQYLVDEFIQEQLDEVWEFA
jgi:hypothetical protein